MPKILLYTPQAGSNLLGPVNLLDGQAISATILTYADTVKSLQLNYLIERNGQLQSGRLIIVNDGINSNISITDESTDSNINIGVTFSAELSGSDLLIKYTSTVTGFPATMKYYEQKWE